MFLGHDHRAVQTVVQNLKIAHIEARTEDDPDVVEYTHLKLIETVKCKCNPDEAKRMLRKDLVDMMRIACDLLYKFNLLLSEYYENIHNKVIEEVENRFGRLQQRGNLTLTDERDLSACLIVATICTNARTVLNDSGPVALYNYLQERQIRTDLNRNQKFLNQEHYKRLNLTLERIAKDPSDREHVYAQIPKTNQLRLILEEHFGRHYRGAAVARAETGNFGADDPYSSSTSTSTRVIVFANLRATVDTIVTQLHGCDGIRPHGFVGQGSKSAGASGSSSFEYRETFQHGEGSTGQTGLNQKEQVIISFSTANMC